MGTWKVGDCAFVEYRGKMAVCVYDYEGAISFNYVETSVAVPTRETVLRVPSAIPLPGQPVRGL